MPALLHLDELVSDDQVGERIVVVNLQGRWEVLPDKKWLYNRGFRHWQEMETWKPSRHDRRPYGLSMSESEAYQ